MSEVGLSWVQGVKGRVRGLFTRVGVGGFLVKLNTNLHILQGYLRGQRKGRMNWESSCTMCFMNTYTLIG